MRLGRMLNRLHPPTFNEVERIVFALTDDSRELFPISHDLSCRWWCNVVIPMLGTLPGIIFQTYMIMCRCSRHWVYVRWILSIFASLSQQTPQLARLELPVPSIEWDSWPVSGLNCAQNPSKFYSFIRTRSLSREGR